jgi:sensor domain CHASE-containing protein
MGVRQKTLLITGLTLAGLIVILYATSRVILLRSYAELEAQYVRNNVKRALNAFFDSLHALGGANMLPGLPPATQNSWWSEDTTIIIHPLHADSIAGCTILKNLYGRPELAARVVMPRSIYRQGRASISYKEILKSSAIPARERPLSPAYHGN